MHINTCKTIQQWHGCWVSTHQRLDGGVEYLQHQVRSPLSEALVKSLRGNAHSSQGGNLGQLFKSSLWIGKPTEDERLHEHCSCQLRATLHEAAQLCGIVSNIGQQSLHNLG